MFQYSLASIHDNLSICGGFMSKLMVLRLALRLASTLTAYGSDDNLLSPICHSSSRWSMIRSGLKCSMEMCAISLP